MGFILCAFPYLSVYGQLNDYFMNFCLIIGIVSGIIKNPLSLIGLLEVPKMKLYLAFARARAKAEEKDSYHRYQEDLHRQEQEAGERVNKQYTEAEEELRRQAEELHKRAKEQKQREEAFYKEQQENQNKQSSQSEGEPLNPTKLEDAYEILGTKLGLSLAEYKKARDQIAKQYHPNFVNHLGDELKELAEKKMKLINVAFDTIKKHLGEN